jgi:hypothetical protein
MLKEVMLETVKITSMSWSGGWTRFWWHCSSFDVVVFLSIKSYQTLVSLMIELLLLTGWWSFDHELCLIYHSFFNRSFVSLLLNFCFIKHQFYTNPRGNALSFLSSIILVQYRPLTWS